MTRRVLAHLAVSFSPTSGGRTMATFLRAALLAGEARESWILTTNFRMEYDLIFREWAERVDLPASVSLRNFFEDLADEPVYRNDDVRRFTPPRDAVRRGPRRWVEHVDEGHEVVYRTRDDRSLHRRDVRRSGQVVESEFFDHGGRLRLRNTVEDGTVVRRDYLADGARVYATLHVDEDGGRALRVEGGPFDTAGEVVPEGTLFRRWLASFGEAGDRVVFFVEDRNFDRYLLRNELLDSRHRVVVPIHSTHLLPPYDDPHRVKPYNGNALGRMDSHAATVVLTEEQARDVREHYDESGLRVIPHPVRPAWFWRAQGRQDQRVVVATRLVGLKRVDHMIRAMARVVVDHPAAELHVWGAGPELPGLRELARDLGIADRVVFEGHTSDVPAALRSGAVGLSASESEGFGLSVIDAMSAGVPVVSYAYKYGPSDLITPGRDGFLVPDGDVEAMAERVSWLLSHPLRRRLMGFRARFVQVRFRPAAIRRRWRRLLHDVDATPPAGRPTSSSADGARPGRSVP
ncbi:glycosyltransferase [Isoptericola sp. b515]|uniref:glycosyltransferase n=1 Tax=Isoptericola sp. b515 TaxID=3064652 RepID=UPI002712F224|nr:glycosyltransferase [Isoptericola sp. b515]MDO8147998.1 glycosyltransferase [Isoptericola sp. b515]